MTAMTTVVLPLKVDGIEVGLARVTDEGDIMLLMGTSNEVGKEIFREAYIGQISSLTIGTIPIPAVRVPEPKADTIPQQ